MIKDNLTYIAWSLRYEWWIMSIRLLYGGTTQKYSFREPNPEPKHQAPIDIFQYESVNRVNK